MIYIILVLALVLRLINLNQSLWLDEAVQAITAQKSLGYIFQEITGDFHPPLYHFLMHFWVRIFGSSEISLRMPSVIFGTATIWVLYLIAKLFTSEVSPRRRRGPSTSEVCLQPLAAIFLATAPLHIYYSQEARMYSLAAFLTTGSFYFFLRILEDDSGWLKDGRGVGYFLFTLLALYTDYYAFLILLAQMIFLAIKKKYKPMILNSLFIILCYLPWLPMFITQMKVGVLATQNLPEWGKLVNVSFLKAIPLTLIKFSIGRITIFDKKIYGVVVVCLMAGYSWLMIKGIRGWLKETKRQLREQLRDVKGTVIILWFFVPLLIAWLASLFIPNYQPFRLLLILPSFYLLLARGIHNIKSPLIQKLFIFLILSVNFVSLGVYYFNPYFHREDWRGTVAYLSKKPDTVVILPSETSSWPIRYYDPEQKINLFMVAKEVGVVGEIGEIEDGKGNQIYYIRYLVPLFDPNERILAKLEEQGYTKTKEISFNQIPVWVFEKQ